MNQGISEAAPRAAQQPTAPPDAIHISTADGDSEPLQLESLCMRCHETGTTTMLLVDIPHFRELLIASFDCPDCGFRNSEVQFAGAFGDRGTRHTLRVAKGREDLLRRQIVKSNHATVAVLELQFEIPPGTQKGVITTVEGMLQDASSGLRELQDARRQVDPDTAAAIDAVLDQLDACAAAERGFTLTVEDPAGCSHVEPGDADDGTLEVEHFDRTREQSEALGLAPGAAATAADAADGREPSGGGGEAGASQVPEGAGVKDWELLHGANPVGAPALRRFGAGIHAQADGEGLVDKFRATPDEVVELPGHCFACGAQCDTRMFHTSIPHFKSVIIMSNACDACGYRDSEVKPGGGFSPAGCTITLQVSEQEDLRRDVIKSDSADVLVPELELHTSTGSLGGLITTVEGLLTSVQDSFKRLCSFGLGDSAEPGQKARYMEFFSRLDGFARLDEPWTLIIKDPLANSFVAPLTEDPADDMRLKSEDFARSAEEDAEYGIDHLRAHEGAGAIAGGIL